MAGGASRRSAAGHAANAGTNTSGAGGLYPSEACGLIALIVLRALLNAIFLLPFLAAQNQRFYEAELHRVRGMVMLSDGSDVDAAAANFDRAIEVARCQSSRFLELRAATSKARLCLERGRHQSARDLLAPVYSSFSEGLDTADLVEARSLLNELM